MTLTPRQGAALQADSAVLPEPVVALAAGAAAATAAAQHQQH